MSLARTWADAPICLGSPARRSASAQVGPAPSSPAARSGRR